MGDCESSYTQDHSEEESRQVLYPLQRAPESGVKMERTHLSSLSVPNHGSFPHKLHIAQRTPASRELRIQRPLSCLCQYLYILTCS